MVQLDLTTSSDGRPATANGFVGAPSQFAPPSRFRSAEGVRQAWPEESGPFGRTPSLRGKSAAQKVGIRYERKVLKALSEQHTFGFLPNQWFRWKADGPTNYWCQMDAIHVNGPLITIFEVKSRFTSDAWYQLRKLYEPVVRKVYQPLSVRLVVICRSFDPWTPFPEPYTVVPKLSEAKFDSLSVLPWRL